jgi:hypothetical protein
MSTDLRALVDSSTPPQRASKCSGGALEAILRPLAFNCRSLGASIHLAWSRVPRFAAHLIHP